jgi:ferredoxin
LGETAAWEPRPDGAAWWWLQTLVATAPTVSEVRISLDADKCQGHNRCYALAPELFDVDDLGQSVLLVEGEIPEELVERARLAAANCPEFAIKVVEA